MQRNVLRPAGTGRHEDEPGSRDIGRNGGREGKGKLSESLALVLY